MAEEHHSRVIVEGDSSSYVNAAKSASKESEAFRATVEKTGKALKEQEKAAKAAGDANENARKKQEKATAGAVAFGRAVDTAKEGTFGVAKAATAAAASFGPWGVAIAVVGNTLIGFVEGVIDARKETSKLNKELRDRRDLYLVKVGQEELDAEETARLAQIRREASQRENLVRSKGLDEVRSRALALKKVEDDIARGRAENSNLAKKAEIEALNAESMKDFDLAKRIRREEELRVLSLEKQVGAKKQLAALQNNEIVAQRALGFAGFRGNVAGKSEGMRFDAEAGRVGAMQREGSDTRGANDAQYAADARLKAIEIERATTGETLSLINQEEEARRRLLQTQIDAATIGADRQQIQAELEQVQHEARLKRIDAERAAEEKKAARKVALMDLVDRVAAGSAATATMIARTAGASAKKQEQIAAGVAGGQAIIIGVLESVKAAAAFASFNPIQGAMHVAAAAFAYAQGGMLLAQAGGAGGSSSGASSAGGGGMPSGGTQSEPSGQTFRGGDSAIPGSPGPQSPTAVGSSAGPNRTTVIQINGDVYGTPRKEFIRSIREGLDLDRQGGRARRTGSDG